jgi:hypothetical protein
MQMTLTIICLLDFIKTDRNCRLKSLFSVICIVDSLIISIVENNVCFFYGHMCLKSRCIRLYITSVKQVILT